MGLAITTLAALIGPMISVLTVSFLFQLDLKECFERVYYKQALITFMTTGTIIAVGVYITIVEIREG